MNKITALILLLPLSAHAYLTPGGGGGGGSGITSLTGEVTATGPGAAVATIANNAITAAKIAAGTITNVKFAVMPAFSVKANNTGGGNFPQDVTFTQLTASLDHFNSAIAGIVPASGGGTDNWLRADGAWTSLPGATISFPVVGSFGASVLYVDGGGVLAQDPTNFYYDGGSLNLASIKIPGGNVVFDIINLIFSDIHGGPSLNLDTRVAIAADGTPLIDYSGVNTGANYYFSSGKLVGDGSGLSGTDARTWLTNNGGNDGGVPYYADSSTIASSATLANHVVVVGAGAASSGPHTIAGGTGGAGLALLSTGTGTDPAFSAIPKPIAQNFADAGNTSTSETDLYSYSMPSQTFNNFGVRLRARYGGIFVNSTSTKQLRAYLDGNVIFDSGALTISASSSWSLDITCMEATTTTGRCVASLNTSGASLAAGTTYTLVTVANWNATRILKITGQAAGVGAATNDIVAKLNTIEWSPAAP